MVDTITDEEPAVADDAETEQPAVGPDSDPRDILAWLYALTARGERRDYANYCDTLDIFDALHWLRYATKPDGTYVFTQAEYLTAAAKAGVGATNAKDAIRFHMSKRREEIEALVAIDHTLHQNKHGNRLPFRWPTITQLIDRVRKAEAEKSGATPRKTNQSDDALRAELLSTTDKMKTLSSELDRERNQFRSQRSTFEQKIEELAAEVVRLEAERNAARAEVERLRAQLASKDAPVALDPEPTIDTKPDPDSPDAEPMDDAVKRGRGRPRRNPPKASSPPRQRKSICCFKSRLAAAPMTPKNARLMPVIARAGLMTQG